MTFFKSSKHQRLLWSLLLLSVGAAAGFGLGIFCGAEPPVGCRESDLTPVPDESFVSPASASSVETSPEPEPMPEKWVCLTFDDGPSDRVTPRVLDTLKAYNVHATFFIVNYGESGKALIRRMIDEGHTVAIHGYSHDYAAIYKSDEAFMQNIYRLRDRLRSDFGYEAAIIRFPGGSSNTVSRQYSVGIMSRLAQRVQAEGFTYFDWNVSSGDAAGTPASSDQIYNNVTSALRHGRSNVVLMHDAGAKGTTADALPDIIRYCLANGYSIQPITPATKPVHHGIAN